MKLGKFKRINDNQLVNQDRGTIQYIVGSCTFHISTQYANLHSNYNRKTSELIAIYVYFCTYEGHLHEPIFFAIQTTLKITKMKTYFIKRNKSLFQRYFNPKLSKCRKMDSANCKSAKWDSAIWDVTVGCTSPLNFKASE